jgi:hypothetical protein
VHRGDLRIINAVEQFSACQASVADHTSSERCIQQSLRGFCYWRPDSEFWSANRAEHRFADGYELVAFDLPAANGYPATIGWELFGGLEYMTLVASGQAASFGEAKDACEEALVQALAALEHPPMG